MNNDVYTVLYEGKFARLSKYNTWEYVERVGVDLAAILVAVTNEGKLLLVEQYRPPMRKNIIELPAGLVGDSKETKGEDVLITAERELLEETGYTAESFEFLASGPVTPGLANEQIAFVRATGLKRVASGGGVDDESIIIHEIPVAQVPAWLLTMEEKGCLYDPKIYAALYFATTGPKL